MDEESTDIEEGDVLPDEVIRLLQASDSRVSVLTSRVDHALTTRSRHYFAGRQTHPQPRALWSRSTWGVAAAASVLVAVAALISLPRPVQDDIYTDIDGSGMVDIADVLLAAKRADASGYSTAQVNDFARKVVSLSERKTELPL